MLSEFSMSVLLSEMKPDWPELLLKIVPIIITIRTQPTQSVMALTSLLSRMFDTYICKDDSQLKQNSYYKGVFVLPEAAVTLKGQYKGWTFSHLSLQSLSVAHRDKIRWVTPCLKFQDLAVQKEYSAVSPKHFQDFILTFEMDCK